MNWLRKILRLEPKMTYLDFQRMTQKNLDRMLQKMEDDKWFNAIDRNAIFLNEIEDSDALYKGKHHDNIFDFLREPLRIKYNILPAVYHVHDEDTAKYIGADFNELVELRRKLLRNNERTSLSHNN